MASIRTIRLPWTTVVSTSTSELFYPATEWMPAGGVEAARASIELLSRTNELSVTVGYQVADVIDDPGSGVAITNLTAATADGVTFGADFDATTLPSNTKGKQLIRWGYLPKNTSGSNTSTGRVCGKLEVQVCG